MNESLYRQLAETINHNADLLIQHLDEGNFVHRQDEESQSWEISHNLGSLRPLIETYDTDGNKIGHGVNRATQTLQYVELTFAVPMSGTAILRF